jgi:hypothetical protein
MVGWDGLRLMLARDTSALPTIHSQPGIEFCMPLEQRDPTQTENDRPRHTGSRLSMRILLGIVCLMVLAYVWLYLGPFWESLTPDGNSFVLTWRTAVAFALLFVATQWASFALFRRRIAFPVFVGLVLFVALAAVQLNSKEAFFWERRSPEGTFTVGWRSNMLFALFFAATQGVSFLAFRWLRRARPLDLSL